MYKININATKNEQSLLLCIFLTIRDYSATWIQETTPPMISAFHLSTRSKLFIIFANVLFHTMYTTRRSHNVMCKKNKNKLVS